MRICGDFEEKEKVNSLNGRFDEIDINSVIVQNCRQKNKLLIKSQ